MYDNEPEQIYRTACRLLDQGISVIPTGGGVRAKEPHTQALIASGHTYTNDDGELRGSWKPMQTQLPSAEDLQSWYLQTRARGLGMVTGELSGHVVIDVDLEGLPLMGELANWVGNRTSFHRAAARTCICTIPASSCRRTPAGVKGPCLPASTSGATVATSCFRPAETVRVFTAVLVSARGSASGTCRRKSRQQGRPSQLRQALGLTPPAPPESQAAEEHIFYPFDAHDERCPMFLMLDRVADYAPESRNKGAFMLGLWANANDYSRDEALRAAGEYTDMVRGVKRTPFTLDEAQKAVASAYIYPRKDRWRKREEIYP